MRISDWSSDVCSSDLTASKAPVEAPLGTAAREKVPSSSCSSTSTVGLPRESRISRAPTAAMEATRDAPGGVRSEERRVGKECSVRVDLGGRRILKKQKHKET